MKAALGAALLAGAAGAACAIDLHAYWDDRCSGCHGHSATFARSTLQVQEGRLAGRHHRDDLAGFLRGHYLNDDLVAPISAMLLAQVSTPPLFGQKCGGCHGTAAEFVRGSVDLRDGTLVGRRNGLPVAEFLRRHGQLAPAEVGPLVDVLRRVHRETSTP